jgi:hypothetical protein
VVNSANGTDIFNLYHSIAIMKKTKEMPDRLRYKGGNVQACFISRNFQMNEAEETHKKDETI